MSKLQFLLLYKERTTSNSGKFAQSVSDNMNFLSDEQSLKIHEYMENGLSLLDFMGMTVNPLTGVWDVPNFVKTDGKYVWDGVLTRWVKLHRVRLPQEFLTHIENLGSNYSTNSNLDETELLGELKRSERIFIT